MAGAPDSATHNHDMMAASWQLDVGSGPAGGKLDYEQSHGASAVIDENEAGGVLITGEQTAFSGHVAQRLLAEHRGKIFQAPVPAYDGQPMSEFESGIKLYEAQLAFQAGSVVMPESKLFLFTLNNARLVIFPELDGMILTAEGDVMYEPSCFRNRNLSQVSQILPAMPVGEALGEVMSSVDAACTNYFHWLCQCVSKLSLARPHLPAAVKFVVPSATSLFSGRAPAFTELTYSQTLQSGMLGGEITCLDRGIYPVKRLHFIWHQPVMPEVYLSFAEVYQAFDTIDVPARPDLPRRFYITREGTSDSRIRPEQQTVIEEVLAARGIAKVFLEKLEFPDQVALFRQAEFVMAPHGAGLTNLVFTRPGTRVLELNRPLSGEPHLRNCFYLMAAERKNVYSLLNIQTEQLSVTSLNKAIDRLFAGC